jgi:predicted PurR-regulated permease PerM
MLDQILAYNERQYEDINTRLKSKFTLRQKLASIFRKYGLTITAVTLALGLIIDTIVSAVKGTPNFTGGSSNNNIKQSLKNFSNWLLEMAKKAVDNLPSIIGSIISVLLKATASVVGFLAEHLILFVIALAFALYEALKLGYQDIERRRK